MPISFIPEFSFASLPRYLMFRPHHSILKSDIYFIQRNLFSHLSSHIFFDPRQEILVFTFFYLWSFLSYSASNLFVRVNIFSSTQTLLYTLSQVIKDHSYFKISKLSFIKSLSTTQPLDLFKRTLEYISTKNRSQYDNRNIVQNSLPYFSIIYD